MEETKEVVCNITPNFICIKTMLHSGILISSMLILGALGGVARGALDRLNSDAKAPKNYDYTNTTYLFRRLHFWLQHMVLGMGGAACAVFLTLLLSKYTLNISDLQSIILFATLSVLGGIMAKRCLPILGDRLSREIAERVSQSTKQVKKEIDEVKTEVAEESKNYSAIIADADVVLKKKPRERDIPEIELAIENMESSKVYFETDRVFCIRLGRLYRAMFDKTGKSSCLDNAIITLRNYIVAMEQNKKMSALDKKNMASAYFNIACYHSLKMQTTESQKNRLADEAIDALKQAIEFDFNLKDELSDKDLDAIRDCEKFKQIS